MRKTITFFAVIFMLTASMTTLEAAEADLNVLVVPDEYPTINTALQSATDGDTVLVRMGTYNETVTITKAITLRGEDTNRTIINGNANGTVIQILGDGVTVTGLTITYSQTHNKPHTYFTHDIPDADLPIGGAWEGGLTRNSGYFYRGREWRLAGMHLNNVHDCSIVGNRITDCGEGIWLYNAVNNNISGNILDRNDYGLEVEISSNNLVVGNTFQNGGGGVWFWNTDYRNEEWLRPLNYTNGVHYVNNSFSQNNFIGNIKALEKQTMTNAVQSGWDDGERGNYWSDYNGTDSNGDDIGDSSYAIMGEYWTGTTNRNGIWIDQVCGEDHYPLRAPFDTTTMFVTYKPRTEQKPTPNLTEPTQIALIATVAIVSIVAVAGLVVYFKKLKQKGLGACFVKSF